MCLNRLDNQIKKKPDGFGWKAFSWSSNGIPYFKYYSPSGQYAGRMTRKTRVPHDKWLTAHEQPVQMGPDPSNNYTSGFHVYMVKPNWAKGFTRVRYRGGHTYGWQDGLPCVVAKELFIPSAKAKAKPKQKPKAKAKPRRKK